MSNLSFTIIAAINDRIIADTNLLRSPLLREPDVQCLPSEGFANAGLAYNHGISESKGELLVFVHQDVYIPASWHQQLLNAIGMLNHTDPSWAVMGVVGVDPQGTIKGCSWSTGLGREIGIPVKQPEAAVSLDELILVVRRSSGLHFDDKLPGWHLYGTDIVQESLSMGMGAYIINAPVIHNSLPVVRLNNDFGKCYSFLCRKWANRLPIKTCCTRITRFGWPFLKKRIRQVFATTERNISLRLPDPVKKARDLGYE